MEASKKEKEGWYPGKYMGKTNRRRSVEPVQVSNEEADPSAFRKLGPRVSIESTGSIQDTLSPIASSAPPLQETEILGSLKVQVLDIKYLRLSSAKLSIQFGRVVSQYAIEGTKVIERNFDLHDVTADIKISVVGKADNGELLCGIVIIPVTSLLGFSGKPNAPKEQFRQFYPVCISRMTDGKAFKFSPGYADLPGYALNRKEPLGFVSVKVELALHDHPFKVYLSKSSSSSWKRQLSVFSWFDQDAQGDATSGGSSSSSLNSNAELCAMINRDMGRISSLFRLPTSLSLITSVPEVFVFNGLLACLCFVVHAWQLPFICVGFLAVNGFIAQSQRNYANTTIWNEPLPLTLVGTPADPNHSSNLPVVMDPLMFLAGAVPTSLNAYPAAAAAASAIMPPVSELLGVDGDGGALTSGAGLAANTNSGAAGGGSGGGVGSLPAGSRLSVVPGGSGGGISVDRDYETSAKPSMLRLLQTQNAHLARVSRTLAHTARALEVISNLLCFADSRASLIAYGFLFGLASLFAVGVVIAPRLSSFAVMSLVTLLCASGAFVLDLVDSKAGNKRAAGNEQMLSVVNVLDCLAGFLSRVPDELELTHRYIAGTAIVNAKGSEMSDAAINFEKRVTNS